MSLIKPSTPFAALAALALLAGCASRPPPAQGESAHAPTPLEQFKITTHDAPDQLGLTVHAEGLSPAQRDALAAFAVRWRETDGGMVTLQAPSDAPNPDAARIFLMATESTLVVLGVPYDHMRAVSYVQGPAPKPLVLASFTKVVADAPDCNAVGWDNLSANKDNTTYRRFGCSMTANLAAQIADPRDLRGQTALAPADNTRRMQELDAYRKGTATSSAKDPQANGAISSVGAQ